MRRLPPWMHHATGSSVNKHEISRDLEESKAEKQLKAVTRKRKQTLKVQDEHEPALGNKVCKEFRRKNKAKSDYNSESKFQSSVERDEDLTLEDLVIIAREYVKADEDSRLQRLPNRGNGSVSEPPLTTMTSVANEAGPSTTRISKANEARVSVVASDCELGTSVQQGTYGSAVSSTSELNPNRLKRGGDPTQDMLDLLLGPLLKKPEQDTKRREISTAENVEFVFETKKPREDENGEEIIPHKKKSSLKDKVSMLLE